MDFQIFARASGLSEGEQKLLNEALFSTFEPVRLWLKERGIKAPFKKIAISLADETSYAQWHGHVSNATGICQVTEAVHLAAMRQGAGDHRWVLAIVERALSHVMQSTGWRSEELERFVRDAAEKPLPLVHVFEGLAQLERASGVKCVPWLSTRPGESQIGVRVGERDIIVASTPGPLYLEDNFPLAKASIRAGRYVLLDKAGKTLASVAIDGSQMH